jgi:hypothetical protein
MLLFGLWFFHRLLDSFMDAVTLAAAIAASRKTLGLGFAVVSSSVGVAGRADIGSMALTSSGNAPWGGWS